MTCHNRNMKLRSKSFSPRQQALVPFNGIFQGNQPDLFGKPVCWRIFGIAGHSDFTTFPIERTSAELACAPVQVLFL
ncbi:MAG: hypothetical protein DRI57_05955 [Deltaproteobacteria bacterium]|nr:MAG: hypothetical protein DRI57_05955 [Deltaproteobacteria bacterium]